MTATGPIARAHPPPADHLASELGELLDVREGGQAIVGMLTDGADPVRKVSIIPRGLALDVTFADPDSDRFNYREPEVEAKIKVALGGRAAEEVVFGERHRRGVVIRGQAPVVRAHHHLTLGTSTIRSSASLKSDSSTSSWFRRAASSAASLTRFARSAPTMPGVVAAILRSTSDASGTPRVCTLRIASRPARSGGCTPILRSKRPGPKQRLVENIGSVGRADDEHAGGRVEPVHLGQDLIQRLLALVVAAAEAGDTGRT